MTRDGVFAKMIKQIILPSPTSIFHQEIWYDTLMCKLTYKPYKNDKFEYINTIHHDERMDQLSTYPFPYIINNEQSLYCLLTPI